jgi:hypothetical protein
VLVMEVVQVGTVFKLGWSSWGVQVEVCRSGVVNSWFPSFHGGSLPPRQGESTRGDDRGGCHNVNFGNNDKASAEGSKITVGLHFAVMCTCVNSRDLLEMIIRMM